MASDLRIFPPSFRAAETRAARAAPLWPGAANLGHFPAIDGLRAIAVLAVVAYHANTAWLPGGLTGVDIFFAISGFVVPASILWRDFSGARDALGFFYARRLYRIFPALIAMLLATSALVFLFVPKSWLGDGIVQTDLAAFVGASNFVLYGLEGDYFSPQANFNPFLHTWSLAVEEQFYLVFSLVMLALCLRKGAATRWAMFGLLSLLTIASLVLALIASPAQPAYAFYLLAPRFWELGAGVLAFLGLDVLAPRLRAMKPWLHALLTIVAAVGLAVPLAFGATDRIAYPAPTVFPCILATIVLMLCAVARPASRAAELLSLRPLRYIGLVSYSLYLWHWPVFVLMRWTSGFQTPVQIAFGLALALGLAVLSYHFVEMPLRALAASRRMPRLTAIGRALAACALAMSLVFGASKLYDKLSLSVTADAAVWFPYKIAANLGQACPVDKVQRSFPDGSEIVYTPRCRTGLADRTLFVAGDSHALSLLRMLQGFASTTGMRVRLLARPGCAVVFARDRPQDACRAFAMSVFDLLDKEATARDAAFFPGLRMPRLVEVDGSPGEALPPLSPEDATAIAAEAERRLAPLEARAMPVVLEAPQPVFATIPFRCSDWFNRGNPDCRGDTSVARQKFEAARAALLAAMRGAAAAHPNVAIWDPSDLVCDPSACHVWIDGKPMLFDGDHASGIANDRMLPGFRSFVLQRLVPAR